MIGLNWLIKKHRSYIIAGVLNVVVGYLLFVLLFFISNNKEISATIVMIAMIYISSKLKSKISFKGRSINHKLNILTFGLVYILNILLLIFFVDLLEFNTYISQAIIIIIIIVFRYIMDRKFVFHLNNS